ncbi:thioredoxin family protein [uncultured Alistipes sp.]|uniref:thioredoxin family protein n=1 Tax=uncultured Alistipes sp. TaxID=538949 RepID=UPI00265EBD9C|nr:thioredoxin family protein [uncultured Alistipes sp.]
MKIEVLVTGCAGCRALYETVLKAVEEMGIDADVVKEESLERIIASGVMTLPALVINGKVVSKGRRLSLDEVKRLLNN